MYTVMKKLFRISTVPMSLNILLKGQLQFLNQHYKVTAISGPGKDLDEVAQREGVPVYPIEIERQISPVKDLVSLYRLYRYFKKEKPEIVHSITPKAGLLSMVAAKMAGVPVRMHTFTGLIFPSKEGHFQTLLIWMDRIICKAATHIYPEGKGVMEDLKRFNITNKPLKIIANGNVNGVDPQYFSRTQVSLSERSKLKKELGFYDDDFIFVFVGRLVSDKGINELVAAVSELIKLPSDKSEAGVNSIQQPSAGRRIKLLLVGPREGERDMLPDATLDAIESHPCIVPVGFRSDVRPYFAIADVFVLPSYREGFPNAVLQAGAMELPSIVSDINGCNEIISDGVNGVIVPARNVAALKNAMVELMTDQPYYACLKEACRPHIEKKYAQETVWEATLAEYRKNVAEAGLK